MTLYIFGNIVMVHDFVVVVEMFTFIWSFCVSENKTPFSVNNLTLLFQESAMALPGVCHGSTRSPPWLWKVSVTFRDWLLLLPPISHPDGLLSEL